MTLEVEHHAAASQDELRLTPDDAGIDLARVWTAVAGEVWAEPVGRVERAARRMLGSPGLARALVTTPSLVLSWVLASAAILAVGALATYGTGTPWVALLAPPVAGIGVAFAYGPGVDPAFELGRTLPISDRMVLIVRCLAVCGTDALLGLGASLIAGEAFSLTIGWLIPMTTVSSVALAAATLSRSANVGVGSALAGWAVVVLASAVGAGGYSTAVERSIGILAPLYVLVAIGGFALALWATNGRRMDKVQWSW
jgi:hypothetical protein